MRTFMENSLLFLFHHIHHDQKGEGGHEVHHCGGAHPNSTYAIKHCSCGKHLIDKEEAIGHASANESLEPFEVTIKFTETCPDGGWHIESGVKK